MRKHFKNILSLLLATTVLFASTGVVIASHVCSASKKSDVSIFQTKGCCSKKGMECASVASATTQLKKNCCRISVTFNKLEVNSLQKSFSKTITSVSLSEQLTFQRTFSSLHFNSKSKTRNSQFAIRGIDLLHTIHQLLI